MGTEIQYMNKVEISVQKQETQKERKKSGAEITITEIKKKKSLEGFKVRFGQAEEKNQQT